MIELTGADLAVELLDPVRDRDRFGPRYCTGGYIFQVIDRTRGALLSGPTYPDGFNWFDGQGLPEAFNQSPLVDPDDPDAPTALIGIGECDLAEKRVVRFCEWASAIEPTRARFETMHRSGKRSVALRRMVEVVGRSVVSTTSVANTGSVAVPLRWFPHPFFPHCDHDELFAPSFAASIPEQSRDGGYELGANGFVRRRNWPWREGHYQALDHCATGPAIFVQRHPTLGIVTARTSYTPAFFPIWGNANTFSFEPYLERTIAPGQSYEWSIIYDF